MIPKQNIVEWGLTHPWQTDNQIEQDLLLSFAMIKIANDDFLKNELILRGGTAFHKLFLPKPHRYSEDLDFVRTTEGGIGDVMKRLTEIGRQLDFDVRTKMGKYPKLYWRFNFQTGEPGKIKIEINTFERSPKFPTSTVFHEVNNSSYSGGAYISTFEAEELIATKLRALYQRKKGRDLFDIWLALTTLNLDSQKILEAFAVYKPEKVTSELMLLNLDEKVKDRGFRSDMSPLLVAGSQGYDIDEAADLVKNKLLAFV